MNNTQRRSFPDMSLEEQDDIFDLLRKKMNEKMITMNKELNKKMMSWITSNDTGSSSVTIWTAIMNIDNYSPSIPYDSHDFQRCWNLLRLCDDETKEQALKEVAKRHNMWIPFTQKWNELSELFEKGNMVKFNDLLNEILKKNIYR